MKSLYLTVFVVLLGAAAYFVLSPSTATQDTLDYGSLPPWPVFRAINFITRKLDELRRRLVPPVFLVLEDGLSLLHFSAIYAASKLNIPEILHEGPLPIAEIAKKAGAEPRNVFRILRELQTRGIFRQLPHPKGETAYDQQLFENTPSSDVLRADHPWSVKALYHHFKEEMLPAQVHYKDAVVDSSVEPIALALGAPIWEYFKQNPVQSEQFDRAMIATGGLGTPAVVQDYPWDKRCTKVVDIGGGAGGLLSSILKAYPTLKGTVFDLPGPIQSGRKVWSEKFPDLQSRVQFKEGDFFDASTIPSDSDCYVMKFILHDWNDADSIKILKNIAARMPSGARILEVGCHQHEPETMTVRALMDLNMLNIHGRERTVSDFKSEILPSIPELKFTEFVETRSPLGIVEFQKK